MTNAEVLDLMELRNSFARIIARTVVEGETENNSVYTLAVASFAEADARIEAWQG